jgi:hypothetical protein
MAKFYSSKYEDECYQKQHFIEYMIENNLSEIELTEEKQMNNSGYFWCTEFLEMGEVGESCGKICKKYIPRNGKNGRCRFSNNVYESTDKKITLKNKSFITNPK